MAREKEQQKNNGKRSMYFVIVLIMIIVILALAGYLNSNQNNGEITYKGNNIYHFSKGSFSAYFPGQPEFSVSNSTDSYDVGNGNVVPAYFYHFNSPSVEVFVSYSPGAFANLKSSPQDNLRKEMIYGLNQAGYRLISSNPTTYNGLPALDYLFYAPKNDVYVLQKDIAKGDDLYSLTYDYTTDVEVSKENKQFENTFFSSLAFDNLSNTNEQSQNNSQQAEIDALNKQITELRNKQKNIPISQKKDLPTIISEWNSNVVLIVCKFDNGNVDFGSGFLIRNTAGETEVITNKHVLTYDTPGEAATSCAVRIPGDGNNIYTAYNSQTIDNNPIRGNTDFDSGSIIITGGDAYFNSVADKNLPICQQQGQTGDSVIVLGYPDYAGQFENPTATQGIISGYANPYYTTSAQIEAGNSGGVAINPDKDCYIGIPSAVQMGKYANLGRILNANIVFNLPY